jgi:hypothetical protein
MEGQADEKMINNDGKNLQFGRFGPELGNFQACLGLDLKCRE